MLYILLLLHSGRVRPFPYGPKQFTVAREYCTLEYTRANYHPVPGHRGETTICVIPLE